jgi:hypothetical protein
MAKLPWNERVPMLSINPDAATREDVARMAAELMECKYIISKANIDVDAIMNGHETDPQVK